MRRPSHDRCRTAVHGLIALVTAGVSAVVLAAPAAASNVLSIDVGGQPDGVAVNSVTGTVYVTDPTMGTVSVIDERSGTVAAVIVLGGEPGDIAVDEVTNRVYVANPPGGTVAVIDGSDNTVASIIGAGQGASTVAVDPAANRIYAGSGSTGIAAVLDGISDTLVTLVPSKVKNLSGVAVDAGRHLAYFTSVNTNTVEVFDTQKNAFTVSTGVGQAPTGIALQRSTGTIYVANAGIHNMSVVNGSTNTLTKSILLRSEASSVTVHEASNTVYTNGGPNGIVKIDGKSGQLSGELSLGINPGDVAVDQRTQTVYVTDPLHGKVSVVRDF
jgi:YVTN family beta-propeller protein